MVLKTQTEIYTFFYLQHSALGLGKHKTLWYSEGRIWGKGATFKIKSSWKEMNLNIFNRKFICIEEVVMTSEKGEMTTENYVEKELRAGFELTRLKFKL